MTHRLLHTLVVSSTLLLDACGSASTASTASPSTASSTSSSSPSPSESGGGEAASASNEETAPAVAAEGSASGALALCEPGWPTTKGASCSVDASGITVCCSSFVPPAGAHCCAQPQEAPR
jgi:hypothetical protein